MISGGPIIVGDIISEDMEKRLMDIKPVFRIADHVRTDIGDGPCLCLVQAFFKTPCPCSDGPLAKSERRPFLIV